MKTITWRISQLDRNAADGGVITAHWNVTVVTDENSASFCGMTGFTPDPALPNFVPYADLIEADVLAWVWGSVDKTAIEANLEAKIEAEKNPVTLIGVPWS
jgi:hypothetical protein